MTGDIQHTYILYYIYNPGDRIRKFQKKLAKMDIYIYILTVPHFIYCRMIICIKLHKYV